MLRFGMSRMEGIREGEWHMFYNRDEGRSWVSPLVVFIEGIVTSEDNTVSARVAFALGHPNSTNPGDYPKRLTPEGSGSVPAYTLVNAVAVGVPNMAAALRDLSRRPGGDYFKGLAKRFRKRGFDPYTLDSKITVIASGKKALV